MDPVESLVERRIREAVERGEFDALPGAGRPLDLHDAGDPDWWIKRYTRREGIDLSQALPPPLALRREAEGFPESLLDLTSEEQVRAVLADFNARVRTAWLRPSRLPVHPYLVDVDDVVARWHALRARDVPPPPDPGPEPRPARRRWWRRRRA
jgi:Domain of unknown function (DUF1992)